MIFTGSVVLASADESWFEIESRRVDAFRGVPVTFATTSDGKIRNCVVIRFENLRITEYFIAKRV